MVKKKVKFQKVKVIKNSKGNIIKFLNKNFSKYKFKEIYFSEIKKGNFKGWKYHNHRFQCMTLAEGNIEFKYKFSDKGKIYSKKISYPNKLYRIFVPKKVFYSFKCISLKKAIIINLIDEVVT